MNLALQEGEKVTTGGKSRGEIRDETGEVTGVVADAPTMDRMRKRYGVFCGWRIAAGKVEVLLMISGLDLGISEEAKLIKLFANIKEGDMGGRDGPGKSDRVVTIEVLKEKEKRIMAIVHN